MKFLFEICDNKFDLITVISIGIYLIQNIKIIHENDFVHLNLKLNNLAFGSLYKNDTGIIAIVEIYKKKISKNCKFILFILK